MKDTETLQQAATRCSGLQDTPHQQHPNTAPTDPPNTLQHYNTATRYHTLQHAATRCNTLQHAATHTTSATSNGANGSNQRTGRREEDGACIAGRGRERERERARARE